MLHQVRIFLRFTGGYVLAWLLAGAAAGSALVLVELLISVQIANLLVMLRIVNQPMSFPFGLSHLGGSRSVFIAIFVAAGILRAFFYFLIAHSATFANEAILNRLRLLAFHEAFGTSRTTLSTASLVGWVSEHFHRATYFCIYVANLIPAVVQFGFLALLLLKASFRLTGIAMVSVGIVGLIVHLVNGYARKITAGNPALGESMFQRMVRMARNRYLLKALRTMDREHHALKTSSLRFTTSVVRSAVLTNFAGNLPQVFGLATLMLLVSVQLSTHALEGMAFLSFLYLFMRMVQSLATASAAYGAMTSQVAGYRHVARYIEKFTDEEFQRAVRPSRLVSAFGLRRHVEWYHRSGDPEAAPDAGKAIAAPKVSFEKVDFRYAPELPKVLDRFSLQIAPGEACAIMGASGSGKSTLLGVLMGMLTPTAGLVQVDGKSTDEFFSDPGLRLGFVGPEPYLIEGTVRENLLYGIRRADVSDEELTGALQRSQLGELLDEKPGLLDLPLTESGEGLSTGQKQRLMFARAILIEPKLLVLDEASSNLDERTEALLSVEIQRMAGDCTIIVITHRPAFVKWISKSVHLSERNP